MLRDNMVGQTISHYTIIEKLGEGEMGVVYEAQDTKFQNSLRAFFVSSWNFENPDVFLSGLEERKPG